MEPMIIFCMFVCILYAISKYEQYQQYKFNRNQKVLDVQQKLLNKENGLKIKEYEIQHKLEDIKRIINDETQNAPWLAQRFVDYTCIMDNKLEKFLINKKNPAIKASEQIKMANTEKRKYLYEAKILRYQLDYLIHIFPMLEDAMQINSKELEKEINEIANSDEQKDEYETVKKWLTPEEYKQLSTTEKYQLALDRFLNNHNKSLWEIGISYERYIGYTYEMKGYNVIFNGALQGLHDLGRDVIAENNKEILIIQCKYFRKESTIYENCIFQLYGTMCLKKVELSKANISKKVKGIFITTTSLSDTAKLVAKELGIIIKENENFIKDYPCIKCNINRSTGMKIYHLPFDQQYDRVKISPTYGECYVKTVEEAENLGFRRAMKHFYD